MKPPRPTMTPEQEAAWVEEMQRPLADTRRAQAKRALRAVAVDGRIPWGEQRRIAQRLGIPEDTVHRAAAAMRFVGDPRLKP